MRDNHIRHLWCDGFIPSQYLVEDRVPRITGLAWIGNMPNEEEWEFTLFLSHPIPSRSQVDWESLLPPENMTRWLSVDLAGKRIQIENAAAVADATVR